ncbi:hypothetical protein [Escherichia phage EC6]|uniref:Uncharacterized protein n=1 Tax=Escherichia phage EC6 TaxID=1229757 RepID=K4I142_9CAUD|nr:hypothetical protein ACQ30_gp136 [Escherichia phage EC6]AFU62467.1 hypothetical protein [Escherichia phage EC6]
MAYVTVITDKADSSWPTQVSDKMTPMQCLKYFEQWNKGEGVSPFQVMQVIHVSDKGIKTVLNSEHYTTRFETRCKTMKLLRESGYSHIAALIWDDLLKNQRISYVKPEKIFIS